VAWAAEPVSAVLAYHIANTVNEFVPPEGNAAIMEAKRAHPDLGGTVCIILHNPSPRPVTVQGVTWDGADAKAHLAGPDYGLMWWRCAPATMGPGAESEITLNLRGSLKQDTTFVVDLGDAGKVACRVSPDYVGPRLSTVAFSPDLRSVYLYVEGANCGPERVYVDGCVAGRSAQFLGGGRAGDLAVIKVSPPKPFRQGSRHLFRVSFGATACAGSVRAFGDLARFGSYALPDAKMAADAGLNSLLCGLIDEKGLAEFGSLGIRTACHMSLQQPPPYMVGNPHIYGYLAGDEPDCADYSADMTRPLHLRLGTLAQSWVQWGDECERTDPSTPTITTLDLTFAPQNYFTYAKAADVANADCYTVVLGWPLTAFRDKMAILKRAAAPQPFLGTYQSHWEEPAIDTGRYIGRAELAQLGSESFIDRTRTRGFGRAPTPEEIRIPMLYAIGSGAHGLFAFWAFTELNSGVMIFHGSPDIPEVWQEKTRTSRELRVIAPLIQVSQPLLWCQTNRPALWVRTLACGEQAALVVAVNEAGASEPEGYVSSPVRDVEFTMKDLPWLKAVRVYRVGDGRLEPIRAARRGRTLRWDVPSIHAGEIYLVCARKSLAGSLVREYLATTPQATAEGTQMRPESYLRGRRRTSP
jgi:hypothetical protein